MEAVAIVFTVFLVANVAAMQDWKKERQFLALNKECANIQLNVLRDGEPKQVISDGIIVLRDHGEPKQVVAIRTIGDTDRCPSITPRWTPKSYPRSGCARRTIS